MACEEDELIFYSWTDDSDHWPNHSLRTHE